MNQVFLNPIIVAIDKNSETEAYQLTKELVGYVGAIKLGLEFFDTYGPDGIRNLQKLKIPIFLDLKIHDIPQTVKKTIDTLSSLKPDILNVHALGGKKMMQFALESLLNNSPNTQLVAVTILTSLDDDDLQMMEMNISTKNLVSSLAKLTKETGLSGVVCSSEEIKLVREVCGKNFKIIVPGIRPEGSDKNDQKRIMTPKEAISLGADHLVIGRPITESKDPRKTTKEIVNSIK
jgi:orotidine-5'-phosphate decarboxylase|tara:strand:- start:1120 stop:1821 length:702 start_codon:yes stop_codon:yes gene_type:complete